jgi:hypothetical protein
MAAGAARVRPRLLAHVRRMCRRIERERVAWARPLAGALRAGSASLDGDRAAAVSMLEAAAAEFDAVPMNGYAAAARWCAGRLAGDSDRARTLRASAESWMTSQSIRNPDRTAAMLIFEPSR